jgi:hypothetical protein
VANPARRPAPYSESRIGDKNLLRIDYHSDMSDLSKPPYPGQGEPIPANLGKGAWIVRDMAILFDEAEAEGPSSEMRAALPPTGTAANPVFAFNAPGIAALAQLPPEEIIRANRSRTLQIGNQLLRSTPDGIHTMRFFFTIDGKTSAFTADVVTAPAA